MITIFFIDLSGLQIRKLSILNLFNVIEDCEYLIYVVF